VSQVNLRYYN